jgi:hypothetical protein
MGGILGTIKAGPLGRAVISSILILPDMGKKIDRNGISSRFRATEGIVREIPCRPSNLLTCNHANLCRSTPRQPSKNDSPEGIAFSVYAEVC